MLDMELKELMLEVLREELVPAMGCTEPIALAYAGARGREALGEMPGSVTVCCSGNIVKNVRCVAIPNSGGMTGIEAAVTLGVTGGNPSAGMEGLSCVGSNQAAEAKRLVESGFCEVSLLESDIPLHIILGLKGREHTAELEIRHAHTNVVSIKRDGEEIFRGDGVEAQEEADRRFLSLERIKEFADTVPMERIRDIIAPQIECNMRIAEEGLKGAYGLGIGIAIREAYPDSVTTRMKSCASAASEARMGGCELPVIINSGSGNQGIASSVPVIVYAREKKLGEEKLYRALVFSALLTAWQKSFIGRLSAFCGAVSATCAAGAAVTYLEGHPLETVRMTIYNTLANTPGMICDGAKISCAVKIATGLDAAMIAHNLAVRGKAYQPGSGILKADVRDTVGCVGHIGRDGMRQTDREILKSMLNTG